MQLREELTHWGLHCRALRFGQHDRYLCLQKACTFRAAPFHYMLSNEDLTDPDGCILHTSASQLSHYALMCLLEKLGYARAVITSSITHECGVVVPEFAPKSERTRERTAWPPLHVHDWTDRPLYHHRVTEQIDDSQAVVTNFTLQDVTELLDAGSEFLQTVLMGCNFLTLSKKQFAFHANMRATIDG